MADKSTSKRSKAERIHVPPKERAEFKTLLAYNPNYFGNLVESAIKPVKKIIGNTTYEQVSCVGFNPDLNLLEATVQIKLPGGYNGLLCAPGSTEFVRFYIDYGTGAGWEDAGLAAFNSHDIPNTLDCANQKDKPLTYVVTSLLDPKRELCTHPVLPKVRAILSWQVAPPAGMPNWHPVWGNVLDQHIQIKPRALLIKDIVGLLSEASLKKLPPYIAEVTPYPFPIPIPDPGPVELAELASLYSGKAALRSAAATNKGFAVEPHRFGFAHIQSVMTQGSQEAVLSAMTQWEALNLDWAQAVAALDKTKANITYEELECLGLEYNLERLVATFRVKKPSGFSGDLCSKGSLEYVAFWADWDDTCDWSYLGTVTVNTHDLPLPPDGLEYSALLPVDLSKVRRSCKEPRIARIRAVLSWESAPSTTDPDALNYWGNRVDAHVQIKPGDPTTGDGPQITIIGGIGFADINVFGNGMTKPTAVFALYGTSADGWGLNRECPFGGNVIVQGPPVPGGYKYRLWTRKFGDVSSEQIVKNTFHIVNNGGVGSYITPDPVTGYVTYMDESTNFEKTLAYWYSSGDELMEIRIEMATLADVVVDSTPWYRVQLDNTGPKRPAGLPASEPPEITCEIHIDSGGDCKDFTKGTLITGRFTARDVHFGGYTMTTLPSSLSPNSPSPSSGTSQSATFAANGSYWELNTTGMTPCGYVILLQVWDRSIVGSQPGSHNYNYYDVGFCLRQKGEESLINKGGAG